ncbi:cytochrome c biogenesis protein ResB [Actinocorallia longicatena]|uniref:Cytochrome c biogenesis protein ResB n=1 Tax=Actinocorallia longicatena TaxID=111803 RepID=A0ABP6QIV3_9ACTN
MGLTGWLRWTWRQLTSMRTALVLLFLVALGAVPGSIFPQRGMNPERVVQYFDEHKTLAPILDRFSAFDVFAAPWFAAIYILLFVSLAGCVIPRTWQLLQNVRAQPPSTPRNLGRLPQHATFTSAKTPDEALAEAHALLKGRRFRTALADGSVASEKGYLHETGNLVFHLSLLALLFSVGMGALFGYKGNVLVTEGLGFSNSASQYDEFRPGKLVDATELDPFRVTVKDFQADYITEGPQYGQAKDFAARLGYQGSSGAAEKDYTLRVNHPLEIDGSKLYLLGHGYSPTFKVTDAKGDVAFNGPAPFLPQDQGSLTSEGVVKALDAKPEQLAFMAVFWPTASRSADGKTIVSVFPGPENPAVSIAGVFAGDVSKGPRSVYRIDPSMLTRLKTETNVLTVGQSLKFPDGKGSVEFTGYKEWVTLTVTHDPGRLPALISAALAIAGLVVSFMTRRRRVWVRAAAADDGSTVVEIGGLTLGAPTAEFDDLVKALRPDDAPTEPVAAGSTKE